ncbi:MAG: hypothetical protein ACKVP4_02720 [Hyphomicrobium sp.]
MLGGYRLSNLEIGGAVVAGLFLAFTFGTLAVAPHRNVQALVENPTAQRQAGDASKGPSAAQQNNKTPAKDYQPECSDPKNADLCAQRRMAKAAEEQTGLNQLGLVLLFFTLMSTGAAAVFAWLTLRTMKDTAQSQLRAYVNIVTAELIWIQTNVVHDLYRVEIALKNFGSTPAHDVFSEMKIVKGESVEKSEVVATVVGSHGTLGPTAETLITAHVEIHRIDVELLEIEIPHVFINGSAIYKTVFDDIGKVMQISLVNGAEIFDEPVRGIADDRRATRRNKGYKLKTWGRSKST